MKIAENWAAYVEVKIESEVWASRAKTLVRTCYRLLLNCRAFESLAEMQYFLGEGIQKAQIYQNLDFDEQVVYMDLAKKISKEVWDEKNGDH